MGAANRPTPERRPKGGAVGIVRASAALATALTLVVGACSPEGSDDAVDARGLAVSGILGGEAQEGFLRADSPREFAFPADHGPHPGFRNEWWYFTGNLRGSGGEPMGYQLTLFRAELSPPSAAGPGDGSGPGEREDRSAWRTRTAWMGHLAVTDGERGIHRAAERFSRESVGLSGAGSEPLRVWLEDWEVTGTPGGFRLRAREGDLAVDLELEALTPPVLQGEEGLSLKGPEPGNASFYYSMPRLSTRGSLSIEGREVSVEGTSWLDREWSTSVLSPGVVGWDWFAIRLSDGWSMMVYDLRREDGSITEFSHAVLMDPAGEKTELSRAEVELIATGSWESPLDGARYPSGWTISIPSRRLSLVVDPLVRDQEMDLAFRYWEGAVRVRGERGGREVSGTGFVELTGYATLSSTRPDPVAGPPGGR